MNRRIPDGTGRVIVCNVPPTSLIREPGKLEDGLKVHVPCRSGLHIVCIGLSLVPCTYGLISLLKSMLFATALHLLFIIPLLHPSFIRLILTSRNCQNTCLGRLLLPLLPAAAAALALIRPRQLLPLPAECNRTPTKAMERY